MVQGSGLYRIREQAAGLRTAQGATGDKSAAGVVFLVSRGSPLPRALWRPEFWRIWRSTVRRPASGKSRESPDAARFRRAAAPVPGLAGRNASWREAWI